MVGIIAIVVLFGGLFYFGILSAATSTVMLVVLIIVAILAGSSGRETIRQNKQIFGVALVGGIVLVIGLMYLGILPGFRSGKSSALVLRVWGTDSPAVWKPIINKYITDNKNVSIAYRQVDEATYEEVLVNNLAEINGPDIFFLKNTWITKHINKIYPLPSNKLGFTAVTFRKTFVDAVSGDLVTPANQIIGLPLYLDTLALFYNKDIFNTAGIALPPKNWDEVIDVGRRLTKRTEGGTITTSGMAIGSYDNIDHAFDLVSAIILQNGNTIVPPHIKRIDVGDKTGDALVFYTSFTDPQKTNYFWTPRMQNSFDAFAEGTAVMMLGTGDDIERLRKRNPHLNFGVSAFPQLPNASVTVTYGLYYFATVSRLSKNPQEAWKFLLYASGKNGAATYAKEALRPPARRDLIDVGTLSTELDTFYRQALWAKTWSVPDEKAMQDIFKEAIDSLAQKIIRPEEAVRRIVAKLQLLVRP